MRNYDKTLWENNKTVVDAEKLNNVEDQLQVLTLTAVKTNDRLQTIEDTLPMKANTDHTHKEYEDLHEDLHNNIEALHQELQEQFNNLKEELEEELSNNFGRYFDDVQLEETTLHFYSKGEIIKSIELPAVAVQETIAICGEVICGEILVGQGLRENRELRAYSKSYNPTIWEDGITPINAKNLNNIENKIQELVTIVDNILVNGGSVKSEIHIGNTEPIDKEVLWIDNSDEMPEQQLDESIIEAFASVLKEHSDNIKELFYLSDAYLDDGEFTDTEESDYILEGGIF